MRFRHARGPLGAAMLVLAATGCTDRMATSPSVRPGDSESYALDCTVDVATGHMGCRELTTRLGASAARIIGGQDVYVKLANTGYNHDTNLNTFTTTVTVQNLSRLALGSPDGATVQGVRVFFSQTPTVTAGSGSASVNNPDGYADFTAENQPYFEYLTILDPYEVSSGNPWVFNVDDAVQRFSFKVYVWAPTSVPNSVSLLDKVWNGATSTAWALGSNWADGVKPDSTSAVNIPADSLIASRRQPLLAADDTVYHLRVGGGSTLNLQGFTLEVRGNLDVPGAISTGTLLVTGPASLLSGNLSTVRITGGATLQSAVKTTGPVTVNGGSLLVKDQALNISIP